MFVACLVCMWAHECMCINMSVCAYACSLLFCFYMCNCIFQHVGISVNSCLRICINVALLFLPDPFPILLSLSHQLSMFPISVPPLFSVTKQASKHVSLYLKNGFFSFTVPFSPCTCFLPLPCYLKLCHSPIDY